jgi:hypothetical protein
VKAELLHVFTARFNPIRWETPDRHAKDWIEFMLDSGVKVHLIECQYGRREFVWENTPHINFVGVRASSPAWCKENILNLAIARAPEAEWIMCSDSDVFYEKTGWAAETVHALQLYHWIWPWSQCLDRGPSGEIINDGRCFNSFGYQYEQGCPLIPDRHGWKHYGHRYPHPGYAIATTRRVLDHCGGLFELAGMGAADHMMALALVGKARSAAPANSNGRFIEHLMRWQDRIQYAVHGRIGYIHQLINHRFHGKKVNRQYLQRWNMFLRHGFNPDTDLKRNSYGVIEWASNKPELEREWMLYLRARAEDANVSE